MKMRNKRDWLVILFFLAVLVLFFWPVFFKGWLPFPGDLLVGNYAPWNYWLPHKAQGIDVVRQLFPWKYLSVEMVKKGELPFWNPYTFAGNPHLANYQSGAFYPLNLVFFLFPFNLAWTIFIVFQPLLVCVFTYWFLRELKVGRWGAVLAGIAFAYSLFFTVWLEWSNIGHAILWLPLCLFLIEKIIKQGRLKWFLLLTFSLASSFLAGYVQVTIYLLGTVCLYFFYRLIGETCLPAGKVREIGEIRGKILLFLGSLAVSLFLCSPQLLPTWQLFSLSAREAYPYERMISLLLPWFYPVATFVPDFFGNPASRNYWYPGTYIERVSYIGVLPLFFAFLAIFSRKTAKRGLFFVLMALAVLVLTVNLWPARVFYRLQIPFVSTGVPTRILWLFAFGMSVLAGMGFDSWLKNKKKTLKPVLVFGSVYAFCWLFVFLTPRFFPSAWWVAHLAVSRRNLVVPTGIVVAFGGLMILGWLVQRPVPPSRSPFGHLEGVVKRLLPGEFMRVIAPSTILLLTVFDLFFYFQKITPFSPAEFVYPETQVVGFLQENAGINRFWGYGTGYVESNFSIMSQTYATDGYDALFIRRYGELISASDDGRIDELIPRSDVALVKGFGEESLRQNLYRQRLLNLLGVKYVLQKNEGLGEAWEPDYLTFPEEIYQLVWQKSPWQVYENQQALPRAFLAYDFEVIREGQAIINRLLDEDFDLSKTVILEEAPASIPDRMKSPIRDRARVHIISYSPNKIEFETESDQPALLFLSDNYYPSWEAKVDGQQTNIYRADYSFRAVVVPKGEHQIVFSYQSNWFLF